MDDKIFFSCLIYIFIVSMVGGFIPSDIYTGSRLTTFDSSYIMDSDNGTAEGSPTQYRSDSGFLAKLGRFFFLTVSVTGIPLFISALINILNLFTLTISVIYLYDKFRGI